MCVVAGVSDLQGEIIPPSSFQSSPPLAKPYQPSIQISIL